MLSRDHGRLGFEKSMKVFDRKFLGSTNCHAINIYRRQGQYLTIFFCANEYSKCICDATRSLYS